MNTITSYNEITAEESSPDDFIDNNGKVNHIGLIEKLAEILQESNIRVSYAYPEESGLATIEVVERGPAELSSKTIGSSGVMRSPYKWKETRNITDNTETSYMVQFFDNTIQLTCWGKNVLETEMLASVVETIIIKKYQLLRKYVDSINYRGRLRPGFSSAYNDRKMYSIPLVIEFRTSEIFYESNPIIRSVDARIDLA